jgi:hypothetical protein
LFGDFFLVFRSGDEQGLLAEGAVEHLNERFDGSIIEHAGRYSLFERDSQHGDGVAIFDDAEALPAQDRWGVEQGDALNAWVSGRFEEGAKAAFQSVLVIRPGTVGGDEQFGESLLLLFVDGREQFELVREVVVRSSSGAPGSTHIVEGCRGVPVPGEQLSGGDRLRRRRRGAVMLRASHQPNLHTCPTYSRYVGT